MTGALVRARRLALVGGGGAVGGLLRAACALALPHAAGAPEWSAMALLAVNLSGSLLAGVIRGAMERRRADGWDGDDLDALIVAGFCGGFTSYSAFVAAATPEGAWIAGATIVGCPLAAPLGMRLSGGYPARPAGIPR